MAFLVSRKPDTKTRDPEEQETETRNAVTSALYLKPRTDASAAQEQRVVLEKDVVLRRIRHRKRVNKVQNAIQTLLGVSRDGNGCTETEREWLDDAFSSP